MISYYDLNDGQALLARITPSETYRVLNSKGEWFDGAGLCEGYFFNGEPGAELIDEDAATKLTEMFGSSLNDPQELDAIRSAN